PQGPPSRCGRTARLQLPSHPTRRRTCSPAMVPIHHLVIETTAGFHDHELAQVNMQGCRCVISPACCAAIDAASPAIPNPCPTASPARYCCSTPNPGCCDSDIAAG